MYTIAKKHYTGIKTETEDDKKTAMYVAEINCDTSADIPEPLPEWSSGSSCFVIDTQDIKFLNSQGEWV